MANFDFADTHIGEWPENLPTMTVEADGYRVEILRDPIHSMLDKGQLVAYYPKTLYVVHSGTQWHLRTLMGISKGGTISSGFAGGCDDSWDCYMVSAILENEEASES